MSNVSDSGNEGVQPAHCKSGLPRIRVLVVDDQPLIRRGIALIIGTAPDIAVVGQAGDGIEAIELSRALKPDVVLMDLQMPKGSGIAATRAITSELPATQIVVLTTFDSDDLVFDAIRAGAQAYLLKDASEAEVLDTVRAVFRGESRLAPNVARKVIREFRRMPAATQSNDAVESDAGTPLSALDITEGTPDPQTLTKREEQILELIAQGVSNREIARSVFLAEGTVKNYVSKIMEKLHARTRTELAVMAVRDKRG